MTARRILLVALLALVAVAAALIDVDVIRPRVSVRWADDVDAEARLARERQYDLRNGEQDSGSADTWRYDLGRTDRDTVAALVSDAVVVDTHGIDRSTQTAEPRRIEWRLRGTPAPELRDYLRELPAPATWLVAIVLLAAGVTTVAWRRRGAPPGSWVEWAALGTASMVFATVFCWPLVEHLGVIGGRHDWDQHMLYHWVPYETVLRFGEMPLWNPYHCGGMPMLGNPQSRWFTPFFFLHLAAGPELGLQLEVVAHVALAWLGAFVLGRTLGLSRLASLAPAIVFAGCSTFYLHLGEGHTTWLPFAYVPWMLAAAAAGRPLVAGALLTLAIGEGGVHPAPYGVLALVTLALWRAAADRSMRPLADLGLTAAMTFCLAAPKLFVAHELMSAYPRLTVSDESMSIGQLVEAFFSRMQDLDYIPAGQPYAFHEYGAYIGPVAAGLALAGILLRRRAAAPWLLVAVIGVVLAAGSALGGHLSPWSLLHGLPLFESLRVPSRFLILTALAAGVLAGFGADVLARGGGRARLAAVAALLAIAAVDAAIVGPHNLRYASVLRADPLPPSPVFTQLRDYPATRMYQVARANMGAVLCYEPMKPVTSVLAPGDEGYRGEQYLKDGGTATLVAWSPHRLVIDVATEAPNLLVVNQNHFPSWRLVEGRGDVVASDLRLAVRVPAGAQRLVLEYVSRRFDAGVAVAAIGILVAAGTTLRRRRGV